MTTTPPSTHTPRRARAAATASRAAHPTNRHRPSAPSAHVPAELDLVDLLHSLATTILDSFDPATGGLLVAGECTHDGIKLHTRALEGVHPAEVLLGFTAPAAWWCLGVATTGTAHHLTDAAAVPRATERLHSGTRARRAERREAITLVHLSDRVGNCVTIRRVVGGEPIVITERGTGRLDDCCRRALGVPTAPPPASTISLDAGEWLDALLDAAVGGRLDGADWFDVARLHPAVVLAERYGFDVVARETADDLEAAAARYAAAFTWHDMLASTRAEAGADARAGSADPWPTDPMAESLAGLAHWMDEGMYARLLLSRQPDADDALATLAELLPEPIVTRIRQALAEWGVVTDEPTTASPGSRAG